MGDRCFLAFRADNDVPHHQALAELKEPSLRQKVARLGFAKKIDVQIGRHRQRLPADGGQDGDVHRKIGQRHQCCAGDGAARTQ